MKRILGIIYLLTVVALAQEDKLVVSVEPLSATRQAEQARFENQKKLLESQPSGPQRDALVKQEIQRHLAENKRLSLQEQALRKEVISDLKQKWSKVESDWKTECTRHDAATKQIEAMPEGPAKASAIQTENAVHRATSKQLAVDRNVVHEGVMQQANREVMGGQTGTSNGVKQTAGTSITDPNHRGMNGDFDAGGGYRTTEKVAKILNEIGVKGPPEPATGKPAPARARGGVLEASGEIGIKGPPEPVAGKPTPVRVRGGVLETSGEFGMTVNAAPGADRIGSAGHQAQVKVGAQHGETYVSETGGSLRPGPLKDHVATMDHAKKAMHGLEKPPGELVGGAPDGQAMAKGTLKAANQAGLSQEVVENIARQHGVKNPENILDRLAEVKTGRGTIANADEAAKLQKISRDILRTSIAQTEKAASAEVTSRQKNIEMLEKNGLRDQSQRLRSEVADYNAKAKATGEPVRGLTEPVSAPRKFISGAGLVLGVYGVYEGYQKAKEEMEAKKQSEPKGVLGWTKEKAELAGRTFWHGLGFGGMAEIGAQAGKDAFEQYKKDLEAGKISPNDWKPYLEMKGKAVLGGLFGGVKAITYDAAKQSGTNLGNAFVEGVGAAKEGIFDAVKSARNEQKINEERAKEIYNKLLQKGASPIGAQLAADGARKGDFAEAKRLNKVLDGKQAAKLAAAETETKTRSYHDRKKIAAKKEAGKQETKARENATDDAVKMRETVIAKLKAKGLPANAGLVDGLVRILERDGVPALDTAIGEMSGMQGTFSGSLSGKGTITITVSGSSVTGTYAQTVTVSGKTARSRASITGDVELSSGTISMKMTGSVVAENINIPINSAMSGTFTGKGYKGSASIPGGRASWSVSK